MPAPHHSPSHRVGTPKTARLTVSIWHNVTRDPEGRRAGVMDSRLDADDCAGRPVCP